MPDAVLTGVETRTHPPAHHARRKLPEPQRAACIQQAGAGYAGGIMSAGIDGIRVAGSGIELA